MLRTVQLLPQEKGSRHWASTRTVSNPSRQSATGPPESYPDRTHTGKRRRARTKDHSFTRSPPVPLGARKIEAYVQQSGHPGRKGGSDVTGRQVQGSQPV